MSIIEFCPPKTTRIGSPWLLVKSPNANPLIQLCILADSLYSCIYVLFTKQTEKDVELAFCKAGCLGQEEFEIVQSFVKPERFLVSVYVAITI